MENVKLNIDGVDVSVPRGTNLIEAAKQVGTEVPHYCYHPKLSISGNCRMCLVEVGMPKRGPDRNIELGPDGKPIIMFAPKAAIGCNTTAEEGMVVKTKSDKMNNAREGVMEFLLINHPLDCPICDQAGECRLQEFAMDYGQAESRFVEQKEHKPKNVALNSKITLDDERCIECSRCIRFMKEVAGQDCLGFVNRGSRSTLSCYPGQEPNTNYDLNIVDICPVGALTSNDFRFKQRVWFLKETRSICTSCSRGCNTTIASREGTIYRQTPRDNDTVNECWMCDYGRLNFKYIADANRIAEPALKNGATLSDTSWGEAFKVSAEKLKSLPVGSIAGIGSARVTLEEQFLFKKLITEVLGGTHTDCVPRVGASDSFLLRDDYNPNTAGAKLVGLIGDKAGAKLAEIISEIEAGRIQGLVVLDDNLSSHGFTDAVLAKLKVLIVIDTSRNNTTKMAHVVLPGVTAAEKRGTMINFQGRIQKVEQAIDTMGNALPQWRILIGLLQMLGHAGYTSLEELFKEMSSQYPALNGLNYSKLGDLGIEIPQLSTETKQG